jgi:NAD(P)-dependent dehydrogenase (short-subunit alcohol dehydrogenase family)
VGESWQVGELGDLSRRTAVVTGANSGIGEIAAASLARAGAHVILAVRDITRGEIAAKGMAGNTEVRHLDLADLTSVRAFAAGITGPIDLLINNAGVMIVPMGRTKDGFETHIGVNHLGHFTLTNLMLPQLTGRVVTVSSLAHRLGEVKPDDLNYERRHYVRFLAYAQSKLANLLFTHELHRRLQAAGSSVRALACHPGYARTNLGAHSENKVFDLVLSLADRTAQSAAAGAQPTLYAATEDLPGDTYVGPGGLQEMRGAPTVVRPAGKAHDDATAAALWAASEQLTGVSWPL